MKRGSEMHLSHFALLTPVVIGHSDRDVVCSAHVAKELATIRLKQAELLERVNQARPAAAHYSLEPRALSRMHACQ